MIAPVQKHHALQCVHFHDSQLLELVSVNFLEARLAVSFVRAEFLFHKGQRRSHRPQPTLRHFRLHPLIIVGLDHVHRPVAGQVPVVNLPRMLPARAILAVQSPVAPHNIHSPVAVEVPHVHSIPPARVTAEPPSFGHFFQLPPLIVEHFDRPPLTRQHQVGLPVPVQIAEHRPADQSHLLQALLNDQATRLVLQQQRIARLRVAAPQHSSAHKQIQLPVPIHIRQRQGPRTESLARHTLRAHLLPGFINAHASPVGQAVLVVRRTHPQPRFRP